MKAFVAHILAFILMIASVCYFFRGIRSHDEEFSLFLILIGAVMGLWATILALIESR